MTRSQFGNKVKKARGSLTQTELAAKAGVPKWAVAQLESGRAVGPEKTAAIAKAVGVEAPDKWAAEPTKQQNRPNPSPDASPRKPKQSRPSDNDLTLGAAIDGILAILWRAGGAAELALKVVNDQWKAR